MASYVSYRYEKERYVGMVEEVLVKENDVLVKVLHPKGHQLSHNGQGSSLAHNGG